MSIIFEKSETKENLMRAFAGESQARNRYTFAASFAKSQQLQAVQMVFGYTAAQEEQHARVFYDYLKSLSGQTIVVDGGYPVDIYSSTKDYLKAAQHNEYEEHDPIYKTFGNIAREEGFLEVANAFHQIADIEKVHGDRFGAFAKLLEENRLFVSEARESWICLNCGYIYEGTKAPAICPVCRHDQGYFIRLNLSPFMPLS